MTMVLMMLLAASADGGVAKEAVTVVPFDADAPGGPAKDFEAVVGDWRVGEVGGQKGLLVDGSKWRQGTPSANLGDQAKHLYGERYAEFLDGVKAFAFFPLSVWSGDCTGDEVTLSVRFYPQAGRIDQGAGIAFDVKPDGSYLAARANALEDNLLFFKVVRGKRSIIDVVRGVSTTTKAWAHPDAGAAGDGAPGAARWAAPAGEEARRGAGGPLRSVEQG